MMMDDETLQMYVEESSEHLGDIENDLLAIEQAGQDMDEELVNKVFRAAHSIKGGAGFLGLSKIKDLGHKIENVLDMIRNRELAPDPDVINVVLLAFDKLRDMIQNVAESNNADIDEHLAALTAAAEGASSSAHDIGPQVIPEPPIQAPETAEMIEITNRHGEVVLSVDKMTLEQNRKGGKTAYLLEFDDERDLRGKGKTLPEICSSLESTGVLLAASIDLSAPLATDQPFYLLYVSIIEEDILPALLDLRPDAVFPIPASVFSAPQKTSSAPAATVTAPQIASAPMPAPVAAQQVASATPSTAQSSAAPGKTDDDGRAKTARASIQPESLRVHVSLLEDLMNLAGELVLSRNQLMQAISSGAEHQVEVAGQRIDLVTSELQETIMLTRMQAVSTIFNKFPRVVRDLARSLGKEIDLELEGTEVELDKTIIEGLGDPLTHLVRNSADHGVETPAERAAAGKPPTGTITLKAYHAAGQVNIEIADDGRGLDTDRILNKALERGLVTAEQAKSMSEKEKAQLIFLPGLSTAEKVTDVSGRGVGMDVVKSNLDQLGGQVDIETTRGVGTIIRIKLPLTLAIIPSLLVSVGKERYAIPQVNVDELLRVPAAQIRERIEMVGDAEVLMLRGELIPLLYLSSVLELDADGCRVSQMVSRLLDNAHQGVKNAGPECELEDINLVVVSAGQFRYGLVVDQLHDSVEIVVKPLGRHFKDCQGYAGATIMGDGHVALILDVAGLGRLGELSLNLEQTTHKEVETQTDQEKISLFTFRNAPEEHCAVPLDLVARVELIDASEIEEVGGRRVIKYRGGTLPVFSLDQATNVHMLDQSGELVVVVFLMAGHEIGLLAKAPVDAVEARVVVDTFTLKQPGISGSAIIGGHTTIIVDIHELIQTVQPDWFTVRGSIEIPHDADEVGVPHLLLVEDSDFFRNQVKKFIEGDGYTVETAEDGAIAWSMLTADPDKYDLVVTDIEMPNMDGFELTQLIRADERFSLTPIMALTSLAGEEDVARGKALGIDEYQVKLDKERLLQAIYDCLQRYAS